MHYFQTTMVLPVPADNLHALHSGLDSYIRAQYLGAAAASLLRNERDAVPQYGYRAVPRDEHSSIVLLRSRQSIRLPDERELEFTVAAGDHLSFQYLPCVSTKRERGRVTTLLPEDMLADQVLKPRLAKSGLAAEAIQIRGVDRLPMHKPKCKPFFLAGAHAHVEAVVTDADTAMLAFINGIGHKTAFGFGLPLQVTVTKAGG
jgi:hypothetical protein